jgi:hypothetical protein
MTSRPFRTLTAAALASIVAMAPAMANPHYHRGSCHLAENTGSKELVGYYPNGRSGGSRWVTLADAKSAIESGCGGTFSHSFLSGGLWQPLSIRIKLPSGTSHEWNGPDHLIVVPGRR